MFGGLGTTFGLLGRAFGTFLANPWVIVPLALFFVAMGLSMFGAFEVALPSGLQGRLSRVGGRGFVGAFVMGLVAGIIAAPCTGPPLASLLAYVATTRNAGWGFVLLATYGAGVGLPFWLLAGFSMSLPRPGRWMEWVKSVFGIALFAAALYYLKNVVPALARFGSGTPRFALDDGGARAGRPRARRRARQLPRRRGRAGAQGAGGGPGDGGALRRHQLPAGAQGGHHARLALRRADARWRRRARRAARLLVDFAASWCLPCREFEVKVFSRPEVATAMQRFTLLRVDVTHEDDEPALGAIKQKYGAVTLPAIRVLSPSGEIVAKTDTLVPPEEFLALLARAAPTP